MRQLIILVALVGATWAAPPPLINDNVQQAKLELLRMGIKADDADASLPTPELGAKYGYPVETHTVITEDGYILTLHRIPNGKNAPPAPPEGRPVAFLQHGLLCSSADWMYQNKYDPLAFRLADAGYDLWLGNARGNSYSRAHVSLDVKSKEFWTFSWHEMGKYDLPANFDYIQNVTGKPDLYYIGHSMGTTMFFTCMAERPEYNSRIRLMSALAPVAYFTDAVISPIKLIAPLADSLELVLNLIGGYEFLPHTELIEFLGSAFCKDSSPVQAMCTNLIFLLCGFDSQQFNTSMIPVILGHSPAGTSARTLVHYGQSINSKRFRQFNHGREENLIIYGQEEPPEYDVSKITAPVALYWSQNDWLAVKPDIDTTASQLANVTRFFEVPMEKFNHLDYMWGIDAGSLLYDSMEAFMKTH